MGIPLPNAMTQSQIISMQSRIGTASDGFWGPKSMEACRDYLRDMMPTPNPWPASDQHSLSAFYGKPGDEGRLVSIDVHNLAVCYDDTPVSTIRCHHRIAESLLRILTAINRSPWQYILNDYAGCFNDRPMRGGTLPSLHARGAAIDLRPNTNGNRMHWPTSSDMPFEVMEMFAVEGVLSAGAMWSRDSMHFQWTR